MAKASRGNDQYMLRLPDGLRDRVKSYAERRGTSINSEIVRVLEREFPEQWQYSDRLQGLGMAVSILAAAKDDPQINEFIDAFKETIEGIVSGRVIGVPDETRESVLNMWRTYQEREAEEEYDEAQTEYDEEESQALERIGRPEKYAVPLILPKKRDDLSEAEWEIYMMGYVDSRKRALEQANPVDDDPFKKE